jgi:NAD(P)-dependent dehydrogenase (short-subunit alcohol dehydrogenase family)
LHKDSYEAIDSKKADLTGKSVFITGASKGIGKAITVSFAKAGASFIAVGARSNLQSLEQAIQDAAASADREPPRVLLISLDVTSKKSVDDAAAKVEKEFRKLDILINNAGVIEPPTPIGDSDPELWWNTWTVNVRGPYLVTRAFLPLLLKGDYKHIVNTTSVGAHAVMPGLSAYQPGKLAVLRFTEFINAEYGDKGVLAYAVHPGAIITEIFDSFGGLPEELKDSRSWLSGSPRVVLLGSHGI